MDPIQSEWFIKSKILIIDSKRIDPIFYQVRFESNNKTRSVLIQSDTIYFRR